MSVPSVTQRLAHVASFLEYEDLSRLHDAILEPILSVEDYVLASLPVTVCGSKVSLSEALPFDVTKELDLADRYPEHEVLGVTALVTELRWKLTSTADERRAALMAVHKRHSRLGMLSAAAIGEFVDNKTAMSADKVSGVVAVAASAHPDGVWFPGGVQHDPAHNVRIISDNGRGL